MDVNPQNFRALFNLGVIYATIGVNKKAFKYWKKCTELNPQFLDTWFYLGTLCFRLERYNESIKYFEEVINIDPLNYPALYNLGNCYMNLYQYQNAIEYYEAALSVDIFDFDSFFNLVKCYERLGELKCATKILKEGNEIFYDDKLLLDKLGKIYIELEDFEHAFDCYEAVIIMDPYNKQAENKLIILKSLI